MRSSNFELVQDFQREVLKNDFPPTPTLQSYGKVNHLLTCLQEELQELQDALLEDDVVGATDALVDLVYFALGAAHQMGIPFDEAFCLVHIANLKKQKGMTKRGHENDATKPADWASPEEAIRALLYPPQS